MASAALTKMPALADVLVDSPGATGLYTYRVPADLSIRPGDIVSVPFGTQQVGAIAIQIHLEDTTHNSPEGSSPLSLKSIDSIIKKSFFTEAYWQLLIQISTYYQTPLIRVVRTALPPGLLSKSQRRIRLIELKSQSKNALKNSTENTSPKSLNPVESHLSESAQQLLAILSQSPTGDYSWRYLQQQLRSSFSPSSSAKTAQQRRIRPSRALQQLSDEGLVESYFTTPAPTQAQKRQAVLLTRSPTSSNATSLTNRQRDLLHSLERAGGQLWLSDALQQLRTTTATLKKISQQGYLVIEPKEKLRVSSHSAALPDVPKSLTADQKAALNLITSLSGYGEVLLHGVTGSGKTEVYLQAIAPILDRGQSALVLVPEIGLTPQLTDRFTSRFGDRVCIYHSGLSDGERYDTWRQAQASQPQVIIGTRSAVFIPLRNLGLILLDEEHDSSFKQDQPMPCYHTRQVASWRAELECCPLVLGSATPAVESWSRFIDRPTPGRHYLTLPQRVHSRPLPPMEIVDMRKELHEGNRTIFSRPLQKALESLVETDQQGILFIHRRGHSSFVSCRSCGEPMECPNCDVSLSYHQPHPDARAMLRCHYCGYSRPHPEVCPACRSPYLKTFGSGTQRVMNELSRYLPDLKCLRFDSDTTRNKGAHRALLNRFANGEAHVLVGTQMLTKGIDLPQVTLVGVIAADGLLFMPDYRASERAFQTLMQVAGRAGRGDRPGRVIVQTYQPEHAAVEALAAGEEEQTQSQIQTYCDFIAAEVRDRAEHQYPPHGRLVLLKLSGLDEAKTEQAAERLAKCLQSDPALAGDYAILGPVPAPIYRVARRFRWHILLKLSHHSPMPQLARLRSPKGISLTIDVDPMNLS